MGERGWYGMRCFNGLTPDQQDQVLVRGVLGWGEMGGGPCPNGATIAVETQHDPTPGPRFLCTPCAVQYVTDVAERTT